MLFEGGIVVRNHMQKYAVFKNYNNWYYFCMSFEFIGADLEKEKILNKRMEEISMSVRNGGLDPDGSLRFKDYADALAFQELAADSGLKVKIIEPSVSQIKRGGFLAEMFIVRPVEITDERNKS